MPADFDQSRTEGDPGSYDPSVRAYPQPGDSFGAYDIVDRIGRGGMGVVYAAVHRDLERDAALKLLSPDLADSEEYRQRFVREARLLARIDSPHVVRVYDAGDHESWLYIATELMPDGDLAQLLARSGPLPLLRALDLVGQVADGLAVAHGQGVLHRDIKPSNVLLRRRPTGELQAVLCDLGISAVMDAEHTRTVGVLGTLGYMAPERHEGGQATVASDVYALGCLLWATITGTAPYVGTDVQVALGHLNGPVPQLSADVDRADGVNVVLARAMAKDPADRYSSAAEVREAVADLARAATPADVLKSPTLVTQRAGLDDTLLKPPPRPMEPVPAIVGEAVRAAEEDTVRASGDVVTKPEPAPTSLRRPGRRRTVLMGLIMGAVLVVAVLVPVAITNRDRLLGGDGTPEVVARVGDEVITEDRLEELTTDFCAYVTSQLPNDRAVPLDVLRSEVVGALAVRAAARQLAAERGISVGGSYEDTVKAADRQLRNLSVAQRRAVIEVQGASSYVLGVESAVSLLLSRTRDLTSDPDVADGHAALLAWLGDHEVDIDPRFHVSIAQGAVTQTDAATDDPKAALGLPADERCGGPA